MARPFLTHRTLDLAGTTTSSRPTVFLTGAEIDNSGTFIDSNDGGAGLANHPRLRTRVFNNGTFRRAQRNRVAGLVDLVQQHQRHRQRSMPERCRSTAALSSAQRLHHRGRCSAPNKQRRLQLRAASSISSAGRAFRRPRKLVVTLLSSYDITGATGSPAPLNSTAVTSFST